MAKRAVLYFYKNFYINKYIIFFNVIILKFYVVKSFCIKNNGKFIFRNKLFTYMHFIKIIKKPQGG